MKALTVRQPHAQLISLGVKTIETRSKPTKYRGELLIHAGKAEAFQHGVDIGEWRAYRGDRADRPGAQPARMYGHRSSNEERFVLPLGVIVASCKLVDCVPIVGAGRRTVAEVSALRISGAVVVQGDLAAYYHSDTQPDEMSVSVTDQVPYGDFTPGRFAWLLEDIKPVEQRCPACWDRAIKSPNGKSYYADCLTCENGVCQPIPAKGNQGLWEWTP